MTPLLSNAKALADGIEVLLVEPGLRQQYAIASRQLTESNSISVKTGAYWQEYFRQRREGKMRYSTEHWLPLSLFVCAVASVVYYAVG
jgi:hypothetical protein